METSGTSGLPNIIGYEAMSEITGKSYSTLSRWASKNDFRQGVYMGRGMFNLSLLNYWINKSGTFLRDRRK